MEALAKEKNLHRIPIIDQERKLVTVITQSQIVEILGKNMDKIGQKKDKPVSLVERFMEPVFTIHEDSIAMDAFKMMAEKVSERFL